MSASRRTRDEEFAVFIAAQGSSLLRRAVILTGSFTAAEDLTQATLLRCWLHWSKIRDPEAAFGYARTTMVRLAVRGRRRRWRSEAPSAAPPEFPAVDHGFGQVDDGDVVRRLLAQLPPAQRAVLVLRYLDDQTEEQTAVALGCSVGTVKSRASRALGALRAAGLLSDDRSAL